MKQACRLLVLQHVVVAVAVFIVASSVMLAQRSLLRSGPMLGHVDMREARVWVQTTQPALVGMTYHDRETPAQVFTATPVQTTHERALTAVLVADSAEPGRTYAYTVTIDGQPVSVSYPTTFHTQPVWKWRSDDLPSASVMIGSCFYVNEEGYERHRNGQEAGYGSEFEILQAMQATPTDAMLWLGDNVYLREPDWNSRSGILKRFSHTRAFPLLQPFLASRAHYAIWDDHDFGPNNAGASFWGKGLTLEAHELFWANPSVGLPGLPGIMTSFELIDVQFFLLDDRWYRTTEGITDGRKQILGQQQVDWLIQALAASTATFKVIAVGSQFLTTDQSKEAFVHAQEERLQIIERITANKIPGVVFVTGDVHGAELSRLDRPGTYPLYDFTSSSITAGSNARIAEQVNAYRIVGTAYGGHNFGTLTVSGPRKQRVLTLRLHDATGKEVWQRSLNESDLR